MKTVKIKKKQYLLRGAEICEGFLQIVFSA